jgi:DeoR family myo-inositol catabolism operon transcriptional repressor
MIRFALADHSKFGNFSLMTFCPFEDIDHILTDQLPSKEFCDFAKLYSINIETP